MRSWLERHARHVGLHGPFTPWWLARYYLFRYGHGGAYVVLGFACFFALLSVVGVQNKQRATSEALAALVKNIQLDRRNATTVLCGASRASTLQIRRLLVGNAVASRQFEHFFHLNGFPPYKVRLKQAKAQAASLPLAPCAALIRRIKQLTPPPPVVP